MAISYKTADQLPIMEEVTDNTYALVEENGTLKRVSGSNLGGSGIKTSIIKSSDYDAAISGLTTLTVPVQDITCSCTNMTFEEAYQTMANGEPLQVILMINLEGAICVPCLVSYVGDAIFGVPTLIICALIGNIVMYWTSDGISTTEPSSSK